MKWEESYDLLGKSVTRLREASDKTEKHKLDKEIYRDATIQRFEFTDRKSTRLNSSHSQQSRMPSSA